MNTPPLTQLSPVGFLQTFVLELLQLTEEAAGQQTDQIIERIARSAGLFFEEAYRDESQFGDVLDQGRYIDLIVGLKNRIGGHFALESASPEYVHVVSSRCPFGEGVKHSPELCRMTSSVFGGIAARNFGYAKVELKERIALGDAQCSVRIHLKPEPAAPYEGIEYRKSDQRNPGPTLSPLQSRIDERLHALWCQTKPCTLGPQDLDRPILIAESEAMQGVLKAIEVLAPTPATVLIEGETGVGKELVARAIHATSNRAGHPFIAVNCGAIPEGIVESMLFGHEKGAFTGAIEVHRGYFERADGGTLFLDEIDALTPAVQVRLLRVLQEGEIERVGGQRTLSADVRIVAATNFGLARAVQAGSFRRDLFYRLNVVSLFIPRLAERSADIPHLVNLILKRLALRYQKTIHGVSPTLMDRLIAHDWPGNVRELENTLERAVLFAQGPELMDVELTSMAPADSAKAHVRGDHRQRLENTEKNLLEEALRQARGDVNQLANDMNITRRAIYLKLKKFGLEPRNFRPPGTR
jgi:two-component system response regulator HydG